MSKKGPPTLAWPWFVAATVTAIVDLFIYDITFGAWITGFNLLMYYVVDARNQVYRILDERTKKQSGTES